MVLATGDPTAASPPAGSGTGFISGGAVDAAAPVGEGLGDASIFDSEFPKEKLLDTIPHKPLTIVGVSPTFTDFFAMPSTFMEVDPSPLVGLFIDKEPNAPLISEPTLCVCPKIPSPPPECTMPTSSVDDAG